jgi:hypothetical protein
MLVGIDVSKGIRVLFSGWFVSSCTMIGNFLDTPYLSKRGFPSSFYTLQIRCKIKEKTSVFWEEGVGV